MIITDIIEHLKVTPFQPFALRTAGGREYPVPSIDHVYLPPGAKRVIVADDEGVTVALPVLLITGFVQGVPSPRVDPAPH